MPYDPERYHRRSIRLAGYDYSQGGAYFLTICAHERACLFGECVGAVVEPSDAGAIVTRHWAGLSRHWPTVELDAFVLMPNHVHGIIFLTEPAVPVGDRPSLPRIVRAFKSFSAREINRARSGNGPVWQRGYYEHIIRSERSRERLRAYIADNPARWSHDRLHPDIPW
jgi:putative transposase